LKGKMRAVEILAYGQPFHYNDRRAIPELRSGEVLVQVEASGLCLTDLHLAQGRQNLGRLPRIPGHESAGRIVELGPGVETWQSGQRVLVVIDISCRNCSHCLTGQTQRCRSLERIGFERDGGHADYVAVPEGNLIAVPESLSSEDVATLPDAGATMYHSLISQGKVGVSQKVVVLGVGGIGIYGVQIGRLAGAQVLATSRRESRLAVAREHGAVAVNSSKESVPEAVKAFTAGEGADVVADCIGTDESVREGLAMLKPGGKLLVIAYIDDHFRIPSIPLFSTEKEVIGCRGCNRKELIETVSLVAQGRIKPVIGARFPLSGIGEAARRLEEGDVVGRIILTR
jgi:2-desacetyl-2-hydroxyethyl bacteriochlorophyllide A dehydrogenase